MVFVDFVLLPATEIATVQFPFLTATGDKEALKSVREHGRNKCKNNTENTIV